MSRALEFPFTFTPLMKKRLSRRVIDMLQNALRRFPELEGKKITVGYTSAHLGSALVPLREEAASKLTIRLKVKKLTYQTIGHELTHLLQGLSKIHLKAGRREKVEPIPYGEKQCDIWTLARSQLFCDDPPTYIRLPRAIRDNWPVYAQSVRRLCIAALEKRKTHRLYIQWLESRIKSLGARPRAEPKTGEQMALPF
ncbi:MAG TPA: hypothetical protein VGL70_17260 [Candidatus Binatia bacterium]|jgi:hypothetical protein